MQDDNYNDHNYCLNHNAVENQFQELITKNVKHSNEIDQEPNYCTAVNIESDLHDTTTDGSKTLKML
jgi:hypothetical protein